ncbi:MAG: DUF1552 domain-containing protein [Acidobacteriota bacterium]
MFITKKHLDRRTFLRGAGAAVALPLLDAMIPANTALAQTAAAGKPRMGFIYFPHGAIMNQWTPTAEGKDFEMPTILKPMEQYRKYLTIISGLENKGAIAPPVHALSPGTWLSAVSPRKTQDPWGGITIDQMCAQQLGQDTPFPSLELCTETRGGGGSCDRDYGCSYSGTIAFRAPNQPLPMEDDPRKLFQRLFGVGDTAEQRKVISKQYASILDLVQEEANDLRRNLGAADQAMLSDYLENVREIERRIEKMEARDLSALNLPNAPAGVPAQFDQHLNMMFDLQALAYQANLTRVFTMMMAAEVSNMTYNHIGVADAFHPISHHQNDKTKIEKLVKIQTYHTQVVAKFVEKLSKLPDGDGSMLDHSILLFGSNMSNSNAHDHFPLPSAIIGGGNGRIKGNQHLRFPDKTPMGNLLLTILDRAGVNMDKVGDSTTQFSEV